MPKRKVRRERFRLSAGFASGIHGIVAALFYIYTLGLKGVAWALMTVERASALCLAFVRNQKGPYNHHGIRLQHTIRMRQMELQQRPHAFAQRVLDS